MWHSFHARGQWWESHFLHSQFQSEAGMRSILHQSICRTKEAPLEERRLKLFMHFYLKTRACIDIPAHHALHEFDQTTRNLCSLPNGRGGMTWPPTSTVDLKVEAAMAPVDRSAELVCPLRTASFPPGTLDYDHKRQHIIEGVSRYVISLQEAKEAKFN